MKTGWQIGLEKNAKCDLLWSKVCNKADLNRIKKAKVGLYNHFEGGNVLITLSKLNKTLQQYIPLQNLLTFFPITYNLRFPPQK